MASNISSKSVLGILDSGALLAKKSEKKISFLLLEFFRFCDKIVSKHNQLCIIEVRDIINDDYYYDYYQSDDDYEEQTKISNSNDLEKDYPTKISGKKI